MALYNGSEKVSSQISTAQYANVTDLMKHMTVEVGDIGQVMLPLNENENKRRYLNGQIILQEQFKKFTEKLKKAVSLYPSLACTETEWQSLRKADPDDQCAKFVIDNVNGTIRLPRVKYLVGNLNLYRFAEGMPNRRLVKVKRPTDSDLSWYHIYSDGWCEQGAKFNNAEAETQYTYKIPFVITPHLIISRDRTARNSVNTNTDFLGTWVSSKTGFKTWGNWNGFMLSYYAQGYVSIPDSTQQYSNSIESQFESPYYIQVSTGVDYEVDVTNKITNNNPYAFGMFNRSVAKLNNLSWLKSDGTYYDGTVYTDYYNWILENYNSRKDGIEVGFYKRNYCWHQDSNTDFRIWSTYRHPKVGDPVYGYLTGHPAGYVTVINNDNSITYFNRRTNSNVTLIYIGEDTNNFDITDYMFVLNTTDKTFRLPLLVGDEMVPAYGQDVTPGFPVLRSDTVYQYIAPYNGILNVQVDRENSAGSTPNVFINDISYQYSPFWVTNFCNYTIPLRRGDRVLLKSDLAADNFACGVQRFTKCTNTTPLYFYVGEAEQNLDLINVGNMAENFATVSSKLDEISTASEYMSTVETQVNEMSTVVNTFDTKMASVDEHVAELTTTVEGMADVQTQMGELSAQMDEVTVKMEEVNTVADNINNFTKRYVIETWEENDNGYILYNDGWCEQWGTLLVPIIAANSIGSSNVTLFKEYVETNYRINLNATVDSGNSFGLRNFACERHESYFLAHFCSTSALTSDTGMWQWEAKGYTTLPTEQEPTDTPTEE